MLENGVLLLSLACFFAFFMAYGVGANDVSNAMGTSVGSKALTVRQAIFIAIIFEFSGAYLAGGEVTSTIRKGIINAEWFADGPELLIYGMLAALLSAALWLGLASFKGWPVSTTHTIVGGILGFSLVAVGADAIEWHTVGSIASSWIISPLLAGVIAYVMMQSIRFLILNSDTPARNLKLYSPFYIFLACFTVVMITSTKGLKHLGLIYSWQETIGLASVFSAAITGGGMTWVNNTYTRQKLLYILPNSSPDNSINSPVQHVIKLSSFGNYSDEQNHQESVEKLFAVLMIFTACAMAFAHGSNDVANAIGPLAAIYNIIESGGQVNSISPMPKWILLLGSLGIVFGLIFFGARVMATVGQKITHLTPSKGFAAELSAALTVLLASAAGLPVSTTHTLIGAIIGVAFASKTPLANKNMITKVFLSWVITIPIGAILSIIFFYLFKFIFQ